VASYSDFCLNGLSVAIILFAIFTGVSFKCVPFWHITAVLFHLFASLAIF